MRPNIEGFIMQKKAAEIYGINNVKTGKDKRVNSTI